MHIILHQMTKRHREKNKPPSVPSEVFEVWAKYIGFDFLRLSDNRRISKGKIFLQDPFVAFTIIPYEPTSGWESEQERDEHFEQVRLFRAANNIPDLIMSIN